MDNSFNNIFKIFCKLVFNIIVILLIAILSIITSLIFISLIITSCDKLRELYNHIWYYNVENCSPILNIKFFTYKCALSTIILNISMIIIKLLSDISKLITSICNTILA
jgi:hypothetical protein